MISYNGIIFMVSYNTMKSGTLNDKKLGELTYRIGGSAKENWDLIDGSNPLDLWFHLDDSPSSHVVLSIPEGFTYKDLLKQTLVHCGNECKKHSPLKNSGEKVDVIYTEIKNVSKADTIGSVHTKNTRTFRLN